MRPVDYIWWRLDGCLDIDWRRWGLGMELRYVRRGPHLKLRLILGPILFDNYFDLGSSWKTDS